MNNVVSVIMPTYQRADIIDRALRSVFAQRVVGNWIIEAVVIDDGSTDGTETIVKAFVPPAPHRFVYHRIDHIGKPGLVRNIGLRLRTGELIGYCDSDDIWLPHHLRTCLKQFELYPDTVMVETWWSLQELQKGLRRWQINYVGANTDGRTTTTNSRLHRRSVLLKAGLFNDQEWGEDIDLWTRIGFSGPVRRLKIPTTAHSYTRYGNNVTFSHSPELAAKYNPSMAPPGAKDDLVAAHTRVLVEYGAALAAQRGELDAILAKLHNPLGWRRRAAFAIKQPRSAIVLLARQILPEFLYRNAALRWLGKTILLIPKI
jgi:glycosyltransferase involved in cell wall biosynthesis